MLELRPSREPIQTAPVRNASLSRDSDTPGRIELRESLLRLQEGGLLSVQKKGRFFWSGIFRRQYDCHILQSPEFKSRRKLRMDHLCSRFASLRMKHTLASEIQSPDHRKPFGRVVTFERLRGRVGIRLARLHSTEGVSEYSRSTRNLDHRWNT
jgi:hypothetical protein